MKNASAMYANAVPNLVEQTKNVLMQSNLNYQKDLNEVAVIVAKKLAGREKEIGDGMAKVYANEFTEQELKDLVTFYKSPLGQKLLATEPRGNPVQHVLYEPVGAEFRRNRQRPVPRRDAEARQGDLSGKRVASGEWSVAQSDCHCHSPFALGQGLTWLSSTSICSSSAEVRAAFAPPASPPAMAPRSWSPKSTGWAAPA